MKNEIFQLHDLKSDIHLLLLLKQLALATFGQVEVAENINKQNFIIFKSINLNFHGKR